MFHSLDLDGDGNVSREEFLNTFVNLGLQLTDKRFTESLEVLDRLAPKPKSRIDPKSFQQIIRPNIHLIRRVIKGQLTIPDFGRFTEELTEIFSHTKRNTSGSVANYIPQLARVDDRKFGLSICTVDGQRFSLGDAIESFTIQSTSKTINYCLALEEHGREKVHEHVGREPSGLGFNELTLNAHGLPHNPMINAGAIMACSLIGHKMPLADRFDYVSSKWSALAGKSRISFNNAVYLSERATAHRNRALSHYMMEKKAFPEWADLEETLEFYFQCCSIEMNCDQMSIVAATLANGGTCPITGEKILKTSTVQACLSLMYSCGMYDYSGEWAFSVGLPAKSGVAGAVMVVVPNILGFCIWSPKLDAQGNSVRGVDFTKQLVDKFSFHIYDNLDLQSEKKNPLITLIQRDSEEVTTLIEVASRGDLTAVEQYFIRGADVSASDYDGRSPLHLAAAGGHKNIVEFLISHGAKLNAKDRWGSTPLNDALRNDHKELVELMRQHGAQEGANDYLQVDTEIPPSVTSDVTAFIWAASVGDLGAMLPYVARGISIDAADYDARTALHLAASEGRIQVLKYLLAHNVNIHAVDRWGHKAYDDAIRHGHQDAANLIERAGQTNRLGEAVCSSLGIPETMDEEST